MTGNINEGDEILEMPGSTHRRTWEVVDLGDGEVTLKLTDKAVGYVTDDVTLTVNRDDLERSVEDGVLTGEIVKQSPDWVMTLMPPAE